tara:strand:- start:2142 stop:2585 length:444 start_codon:yes stop_codon:yes gene_type:complete
MGKVLFFYFLFFFISINYANAEFYLTLRNEKVNLRQGPSLDHPVKLVYKKKFLPVLVLDKSYNFRKIIDHENNSGWIHISQLSKKKAALNEVENSIIFKKPSKYSEPLVLLEKGRLLLIKKCKDEWCKIKTGQYTGWIEKEKLRGRL